MRKLRLDFGALRVESFDTRARGEGSGTVNGYESYPYGCLPPSGSIDCETDTDGNNTCAGATCDASFLGSCNCGGTLACPRDSVDYTYCFKDASCVNQCFPTGPGC
jgi:hypothetical protein